MLVLRCLGMQLKMKENEDAGLGKPMDERNGKGQRAEIMIH